MPFLALSISLLFLTLLLSSLPLASASISFSHYNLIRYLSAAVSGRDAAVVEAMPVTPLQVCVRAPVKEEEAAEETNFSLIRYHIFTKEGRD